MLNSQPAVILGAEAYQVMFSLLEIHCYCTEHSTLQVMVIHVLCHFYFQQIWYFSDLEWWAAWDHVHCVTEKEKKKREANFLRQRDLTQEYQCYYQELMVLKTALEVQWKGRRKADCFEVPQGSVGKANWQQQQLLQQFHQQKKTLVLPKPNF